MFKQLRWLGGIGRSAAMALLGGAVGGGILLWLKSNGIDLTRVVADGLNFAQSPENRLVALVAMLVGSGILFVFLYVALQGVIRQNNRPSVVTTKALRRVLVEIGENCLVVLPNQEGGTKALSQLRVMKAELQPYTGLADGVDRLEALAEDYMTRVHPGYVIVDEDESKEIASLNDQALRTLQELMDQTGWAARISAT